MFVEWISSGFSDALGMCNVIVWSKISHSLDEVSEHVGEAHVVRKCRAFQNDK